MSSLSLEFVNRTPTMRLLKSHPGHGVRVLLMPSVPLVTIFRPMVRCSVVIQFTWFVSSRFAYLICGRHRLLERSRRPGGVEGSAFLCNLRMTLFRRIENDHSNIGVCSSTIADVERRTIGIWGSDEDKQKSRPFTPLVFGSRFIRKQNCARIYHRCMVAEL